MNTRSSCIRSTGYSLWYTLLFLMLVLSLSLPPASDARPLYPGQKLPVGEIPFAVAVANLNTDGMLDLVLVTVGQFSKDVSVLLGRGDGTFRTEQRFGVGYSRCSVAVTDVNADGHSDLVVANRDRSDVSVLLDGGDGTFKTEQRFMVGASPNAVVVADLNADGRPDLVTANTGGKDVSVLLHVK